MDQLSAIKGISSRKMFGEYAVYIHGKVVALICDNALYVKPTKAGREYIGTPLEAPAYPGAKPSFLIQDEVDDREWLNRLIALTYAELPEPKPKSKKKPRSK
jgi:TfoX/Sxy family transcriptional regulator of competence genes